MNPSIDELETRLLALKKLAEKLTSDQRWLSSSLESDNKIHTTDDLVTLAEAIKVPLLHPLTIGTLLASVLGEIDSVEWALKSLNAAKKHHE